VKKVAIVVFALCAAVALADLVYHKHVHEGFGVEGWFNFYGFYAFVGCVVLAIFAGIVRALVMRDEDYYDR